MKKRLLLALAVVSVYLPSLAQSKVFKEVSEEISSQVAPITQDNALVGYLVFTRLEKAKEDSFNYKVTIMDENLNDIGSVNFREESIYLQGIAFEQDVLCLAYIKTNVFGETFKNSKAYKKAADGFKNSISFQFLGLDGKIIKTDSWKLDIKMVQATTYTGVAASGKLKHPLQLINVPQQGFACMYGDDSKTQLTVFKPNGEKTWEKPIKEDVTEYRMLATGGDLYLIANNSNKEKGYELLSYNLNDGTAHPKYTMRDKQDHNLKILTFGIDPATSKPYVCGFVQSKKTNTDWTYKGVSRGFISGVYNYQINGHGKADVKETFSYWDDESNESISRKGYYRDLEVYANLAGAFRDYNGNTYFIGNSFVKKVRVGSIIAMVALIPTIYGPIYVATYAGTSKIKLADPILVKLDNKGKLSYETSIPDTKSSGFAKAGWAHFMLPRRNFSFADNRDTKTQYMIMKDRNNTSIYNVNTKKVSRTIPNKDGSSVISIHPAKEGHIMVSEYNKKEKYTRVSIEAL